MRRRSARISWRTLRHRLYAGLTLLGYLATAFGIPIPAEASPSPSETAPESSKCGCATTDDCSTGSCCCSHRTKSPAVPKSIGTENVPPQSTHDDPEDSDSGGVRWVSGIAALKCRGHSTVWVSAGMVLPVPAPLVWRPQLVFSGWLSSSNHVAHSSCPIPPDPPPRLAQV
jgi:hypothetical protein